MFGLGFLSPSLQSSYGSLPTTSLSSFPRSDASSDRKSLDKQISDLQKKLKDSKQRKRILDGINKLFPKPGDPMCDYDRSVCDSLRKEMEKKRDSFGRRVSGYSARIKSLKSRRPVQ